MSIQMLVGYKYLLSLKIEPLVRVTLVVPCNNV